MTPLPLFDHPKSSKIRALLATAGTTKAHSERVEIEWASGAGVTSWRVTKAAKAEIDRLCKGQPVSMEIVK